MKQKNKTTEEKNKEGDKEMERKIGETKKSIETTITKETY